MKPTLRTGSIMACTLALGALFASPAALAADADAAQALFKKSGCGTCHAVDKKKVGPALTDVAKKYKGQADAEAKLVKHLTTKPMVDMGGGTKAEHAAVKSTDSAEIKNFVQWILSL